MVGGAAQHAPVMSRLMLHKESAKQTLGLVEGRAGFQVMDIAARFTGV